jgi:maltooligosyltrehalose trehalohydrolase
MHEFEIWAPFAVSLAVELKGKPIPMQESDGQGWRRLEIADAEPGADYGYLIDNDPKAYPDPRSRWQPHGVHDLSRIYDESAFLWNDAGFQPRPLPGAVLYELHIGTFTDEGTLHSAIPRLDHLVDLGVTHVELMPLAAFAGDRGWGYDGVALFAVHQAYGGPDALKRFVDAAHQKGLAVLLDVVYNHFGPIGNYTGKFGPYLVDTHHTAWGGAVNLNGPDSGQVRQFFVDNAIMWLRDFHLDGLRLDAIHAFVDSSAVHFLEQLASEVETLSATLGRYLVLIAESDLNDPRVVTPREAGGLGMNAQWSDDFHHALFTVLNPGPKEGYYKDFGRLGQLAKALENNFVYDGIYSRFRKRVHGRQTGNLSQHRFIGFIQNHDQIGNRAIGDRLAEIVGLDRAKIAAALVLLSPFIPMLFQGEEWAASSPFQYFADHEEPEMAKQVSEGRRREFAAFGWNPAAIPDPEDRRTFQRSKLNWSEVPTGEHATMLAWYQALICLRRSRPDLNNGEPGNTRVVFDEEQSWLQMHRGNISVACNLADRDCSLPVPTESSVLLASKPSTRIEDHRLVLPPNSVAVLRKPDHAPSS